MRACSDRRLRRSLGLIVVGVLLLAISVPSRFWAILIGSLALVAGLVLWKIDC